LTFSGARRQRLGLILWLLGYGLLVVAWVGGNPPGSAPDEPQHHIKAVGVAYGHPIGKKAHPFGSFPPKQQKSLDSVTRSFPIPARLVPTGWACNAFYPDASASCPPDQPPPVTPSGRIEEPIALGPYIPVPYLPLGLAARLAGNAHAALYAERAVAASFSLALLGVALALCTSAWSRLALLIAVTPSVVFMSSAITTSGMEITASLAHGASLLALARSPNRRLWWVYALTGSVLALARPLGPVWIILEALLLIMLVHPRPLLCEILGNRRDTLPAIAVLATATVGASIWAVTVMPHDRASLTVARSFLAKSIRYLPEVLRQSVGDFRWLNVPAPSVMQMLGIGLYCAILLAAFVRGRAFDRLVVAIGLAVTLAVALYLSAFTQLPVGALLQARYVMPVSVVVLLVAGGAAEGSGLGRSRAEPRPAVQSWKTNGAFVVVVVSVVALQWSSWFVNAHRAAVGRHGPLLFLGQAQWAPPGGWWPWLTLASIGSLTLGAGALCAILPTRTRSADPAPQPTPAGRGPGGLSPTQAG
jgi:hypothetical protein